MSKNEKLNISVLVTARDEYTNTLKNYLSPLIFEGFVNIYNEAIKIQQEQYQYEYIKQFQILLKDIPHWNQTILVNETKRIIEKLAKYADLQKLITAILVSNVKILSSIRMGGSHKNISITIPASDIFIHSIYIDAAKTIYTNSYLLDNFKTYNLKLSSDIIKNAIKDIINEIILSYIPVHKILDEFLSGVFENENIMREEPIKEEKEEELKGILLNNDILFTENKEKTETFDTFDNITSHDANAPTIKINEFGSEKLFEPQTEFSIKPDITPNTLPNLLSDPTPVITDLITDPTPAITDPIITDPTPATDSIDPITADPITTPIITESADTINLFGNNSENDDLFSVGNSGLSPTANSSFF